MKRKIGVLLVTILMLSVMVVAPVYAAPPVYEEWQCSGFADNAVVVSYTINTTNLKTTQFNVVNNSDYPVYVYIKEGGEVTWEFLVEGWTTASKPCVLNFQRLPNTDPDDPDSVRMPKDTYIFTRYPAF